MKAIDIITDNSYEEKGEKFPFMVVRSDLAIEAIKIAEKELKEKALSDQWRTPESEHPKNRDVVLVKFKTAKGVDKVGIASYHSFLGLGSGFVIQGSCPRYITHWMPIPELPIDK